MIKSTNMHELTLPKDPVEASIILVRKIDGAVDLLRPLVYEVWEKELWRGRFSSFGEYIESPEGLNKSQGYASKLKTVEQFRLESGQDVSGIDHEVMYLAIKSGGTPEEIIAKAKTLNRTELKQTRAENDSHPFEENPNCKKCGLPREDHNGN